MSDDSDPPTVPEELTDVVDPEVDSTAIDADDTALARQLASERHDSTVNALADAWRNLEIDRAQALLRRLHGWRVAVDELSPGPEDGESDESAVADGIVYHVDALALSDCYQSLFADPEVETIVYLTGVEVRPNEVTLNRRIPIDHDSQELTGAAGDSLGSFETLRELDRAGHRLLAHCHNHPGDGETGIVPSDTDRDYQQRLENGPYIPLGLIMTQDGYVRLYTNDIDYEVRIHGDHIRRLEDGRLFLEEEIRDATYRIEAA